MPPVMAWGEDPAPEPPPQRVSKRRRAPSFYRSTSSVKRRPATPVVAIGSSGSSQGVRQTLKHAGKAIRKAAETLVPVRWRSGSAASQPENSQTAPASAPTSTSSTFRPTYLSIEREAAAVSAGVDLFTYNLMMDLQHRDITPEDYDTLRRLDSSVAPKTLTVSTLDALSPSWRIPAPTRSSALSMAMCGAVKPAVAAPVSHAGALAALPRLRVMTRRNSRETTTSNEAPANSASSSNASNSNAQKQETPLTEQSCCICLETFCTGHRVRRLPCRHLFHTTCIDEWLTTSSDICPECQRPVSDACE